MVRDYNLWGCRDLFKRNMERHPEGFGDALQLLYRDIFLATADSVQVLLADAQPGCQFCFTHVFLTIAFFRSILVLGFIVDLFKPPPSSPSRGGWRGVSYLVKAQRDLKNRLHIANNRCLKNCFHCFSVPATQEAPRHSRSKLHSALGFHCFSVPAAQKRVFLVFVLSKLKM